jgi:hypothetical protein
MVEQRENEPVGGSQRAPSDASSGGVGSWIGGVFVDPKGAFTAIAAMTARPHPKDPAKTADRTRWWIPLIILAVVGVLMVVFVVIPFVAGPQQEAAIRAAVLERGGTEAQVQQALQQSQALMGPLAIVGGILQAVIMVFLVAGIIHLIMKLLRGKGTFRHARAVTAYSLLINALGTAIKLPLMRARETMYVETGAAIFFPNLEPSDRLYRLLFTGFDIFAIWWIIVLGVGLAAAYRVSKGKAYTAAVIIWLLTTAMGVFGQGG